MLRLRNDLIEVLRSMARRGDKPSAMLHELVAVLGPAAADRPVLVRYFSAAFCFQEGQGYKIFGWFPDGTGTLKDADIDSLLSRPIQETRAQWDERGPGTVEQVAPSRE
jgi:hypothetical protein